MSDDTNVVSNEAATAANEVLTQAPVQERIRQMEDVARTKGWRPLEEYDGPIEKWRSAETFLALEPFYEDLKKVKRRNKDLEMALTDLSEHHQKTAQVEYKRALETLKQEKKQALLDGDVDKVLDLDDRIEEVKEEHKQATVTSKQQQNDIPQEFSDFLERNTWYNTDPDMTKAADAIGLSIKQKYGQIHPELFFEKVEQEIKKKFSDKFEPKKPKHAPVDSGTVNTGTVQKKTNGIVLTDMEKRVMDRFVRAGVMTKEQYMDDLAKQRSAE